MKTAFHKAELVAANPAPSQHSETNATCMICNGGGSCQTRGQACIPQQCRSTSPCVETKEQWELRKMTQKVEELERENAELRARLAAQIQPPVISPPPSPPLLLLCGGAAPPVHNPPPIIKINTHPGMPTRYVCDTCNGLPLAAICYNPAVHKDRLGRPVCRSCLFSDEVCCMYCESYDIQYIKETGCTTCLNKECSGLI